ncbi:SPOR domain-containing protein [Sphingomonas sp. CFBP8993]|uniref:SPOR domain-containing protein n=1 Tax=Sphingomonas sp. CFBP8993 TaxID=3096526 RepID=UPI002A69C21D|nr:SPOR domain-containing protein [Sphingomonas sp. CFBP8993]MDY0958373.1 SPOR domain-containing protein [Sphingomonas sp. CFBP8993]
MTTLRTFLTCSIGALVVGGGLGGCTAAGPRTARLGDGTEQGGTTRATAALADQTRRVLVQRDGIGAVALAERLVAAEPHQAAYRALLGQSYLQAGRFASARQAFTDALQLDPADGRSALNLALAMVAGGNGAGARALLDRHASVIPAADLGLALSLAGDPAQGVRILTAAAREQGASVKTRQNLALSLALAGQWDLARMAASADMAPSDVEVRMQEWADFAAASNPADQVASLLGIHPVSDGGQPVTLALNAAPSAAVMQDMVQALPQPQPQPQPRSDAPAAVDPSAARIAFAARQDVAQPLPTTQAAPASTDTMSMAQPSPETTPAPDREARVRRMAAGLVSTPALLRRAEERRQTIRPRGDWNVQLGAFGQEDGAQRAWAALTRRYADLSGYVPQSGTVRLASGQLHRLSVGSLTRADADRLCQRYRGAGGACFVRRQADDRMAHWARPGIGSASILSAIRRPRPPRGRWPMPIGNYNRPASR